MPSTHRPALFAAYPVLNGLAAEIPDLPCHVLPPGAALFHENDACQGFPMILSGEVRVARASSTGRELELYRVQAGEICLVSSACLFTGQKLTARGSTTLPTEMVLLPVEVFRRAMVHESFRDFVLGLFATRMTDLAELVESIAFQRLDQRLAGTLLGHGRQIHTTHQALADELGTVREMVSRLLHRFEREGMVTLSRECITIQDSTALRALASSDNDRSLPLRATVT